MLPRTPERTTHDWNVTAPLALTIQSGRAVESLKFLTFIDAARHRRLNVHLLLDSASSHKHVPFAARLRSTPFMLHFASTSHTWIDQGYSDSP